MTDIIFSVQDDSGTVAQLTLTPSPLPTFAVAVGDTGRYEGIPDDGLAGAETFQTIEFRVVQTLGDDSPAQFSVTAANANMADWPANGQITWLTGLNAADTAVVIQIDGANAYADPDYFARYHNSRGNSVPVGATDTEIRGALVKATDYLDQRYRFNGIKLLQTMGNNAAVLNNAQVYSTWLYPYSLTSALYLTPSTSKQSTQWPRQGVVDFSGNTIHGVPEAVKQAVSELAIRVLNGTELQPDYDPAIVGAGGIVKSVTKKIGPLETSIQWDTQQGIGFFATFPQVDRMLNKAGLLYAGGGRTVMR